MAGIGAAVLGAIELGEMAVEGFEAAEAAFEFYEAGSAAMEAMEIEGVGAMEAGSATTEAMQGVGGAVERGITAIRPLDYMTRYGVPGLLRAGILRGEQLTMEQIARGVFQSIVFDTVYYGGISVARYEYHRLWPGEQGRPDADNPDHFPPGHKKEIESVNFIGVVPIPYDPGPHPLSKMFPKKIKKTLRWSSNLADLLVPHNAGGANPAAVVPFPANSAKDIGALFGAAGGTNDLHEPLAWTQYKAMYDKYVITGSRLRVDYFVDEQRGGEALRQLDACVLGISVIDNATALTVAGHYEELRDTIWAVVAPEQVGRLTYEFDPAKFFGVPKSNFTTDSALRADTALPDAPTDIAYFHLWGHHIKAAASGVEDDTRVRILITMDVDVTFFEPKEVAQS